MIKSAIVALVCVSSLFAGVQETNGGTFIQIYAEPDSQSSIIAEVSTEKGKLEQLKCRTARDSNVWCKVRYRNSDVRLQGWSDKKSLDAINQRDNTNPTFEKRFGGRYEDIGQTLLPLKDGFLVLGNTESFGEGQGDAYVIKTDLFGNKLWSATYGGRYEESARAIAPVKDGFMITGSTLSLGNMRQSLYVARISSTGELMWENGFFSDEDDRYVGKSIAKINDEHMMIAGWEDHVTFFNSEVECYLTAVSINGQQKWVQRYGGKNPDKANSIIKVNGGYVFSGETESWGAGDSDVYVMKIAESGQRAWHYTYGYKSDEYANQIISTQDGGYIIVGATDSDYRKSKDVYVVKLNADGKKAWQHHYGGDGKEEGYGIVEDKDGYVIVGYTETTQDFNSDVYLLKIDKKGNISWKKTYGGPDDDEGYAIVKVKDGFVITGFSEGGSDRGKDLYLLKVDRNGNLN